MFVKKVYMSVEDGIKSERTCAVIKVPSNDYLKLLRIAKLVFAGNRLGMIKVEKVRRALTLYGPELSVARRGRGRDRDRDRAPLKQR